MSDVNEQRKQTHKVTTLALEHELQKVTIKRLVEMVDQLRQPFNNSSRHDLYLEATALLNELEEREQI